MPKPTRSSKTYSVREDLAERLESEADSRLVNPGLILDKALEAFLDGLTPPLAASEPTAAAPHPPDLEGK